MSRRTATGTVGRDVGLALPEALRPARDALIRASGKMATRSVHEAAMNMLKANIDEPARCFTGDRT